MSLIPFILDLADELHEFSRCLANGIDINDFGFGLYTGSEQQQQQQHQQSSSQQQQQPSHQQQSPRRSRTSSFSSFWMPSKRHHPYNRIKSACCGKNVGEEGGSATTSPEKDTLPTAGSPGGKTASYSVVNKNGFQVSMNVKQFAPNELSVKTIDNCIVVEGRHDDKEDGHGVISRHFVRKYMLPKGYDPKDVLSTLSSDGILTVKAPPPPPPSAKTDEPNERIVEIQPTTGPTQVVPVVLAAKETQSKEQTTTTKKLSSPAARADCQLPEKRQKLELPQEQKESTEPQTTPLVTPTPPSASAATAPNDDGDDDCEKTDEQTAENEKQQQKQTEEEQEEAEGDGGGDDDMETNSAVAAVEDQVDDKQLEKKEAMEIDETDKTVEEEEGVALPETNGDTNNSTESANANEPATDESCTTSVKDDDVPAADVVSEADAKSSKSENSNKMDVDDDDVADTNADADEADAKTEKATETKAAADGKGKTNATETNKTNNSTSTKTPTKNVKKDDKEKTGNAKATGELPADVVVKSAATGKKTTTTTVAESASDAADKAETTAVLPLTEATKTDIDDVALLKAAVATADAADITAADEKNALLSESMDGIATTDSPPSTVDTVECSLFAKTHLGNGNSNSAALVATEEVAN